MTEPFEDVSHWPLSRYLREVVMTQIDGRVLIFFGKINLCAASLAALFLLFSPLTSRLGWEHVALLAFMPLIGFIWFVRDMPAPTLHSLEACMRPAWKRNISVIVQLFPAFLPWAALFRSYMQ